VVIEAKYAELAVRVLHDAFISPGERAGQVDWQGTSQPAGKDVEDETGDDL